MEFRRRVPEADRQGITAEETFDLAYRAARELLDELEAILQRDETEEGQVPPRRPIRPPRQRSVPAND